MPLEHVFIILAIMFATLALVLVALLFTGMGYTIALIRIGYPPAEAIKLLWTEFKKEL